MEPEITRIKGVGPATAAKLAAVGIRTPLDLVLTFPARYERHELLDPLAVAPGATAEIAVTVVKPATVAYIRKRLTKLQVDVEGSGRGFRVVAFNREFLRPALTPATDIVVVGRFEPDRRTFLASDILLRKNHRVGILPVYGIAGITDRAFAGFVAGALPLTDGRRQETLPKRLLDGRALPPLDRLLACVHAPRDEDEIRLALHRIKYEELLRFGLALHARRRQNEAVVTVPKRYDIARVRTFIAGLPFTLTDDQKQATNAIFADLKRPRRMMRLLQGDVGSGKTVCAAIAIFAVHTAGEQTAVMAPTELLARQHADTLARFFAGTGIEVAFLAASVRGGERARIAAGLRDGTIDVVCGTHALLQEPVVFRHLGFAVIDEQHRFGVVQRRILREKGMDPDVLAMSATPIPRTLAISLFGDMDVSTIRTLPSGRRPIRTTVGDFADFPAIAAAVAREIAAGRQAYVIAPLVETDAEIDAYSVDEAAALIKREMPAGITVGIVHGRMKTDAKEAAIAAFRSGTVDILVSTTVVEVGVDVANATVMVVLNAERFGLSQLHQLRGRVGRGADQSYCHLVTDKARTEDDRLEVLANTVDGFVVAEEDLRRRGPGDVFGEEQTGLPRFRAANVVEDAALLEAAFADAMTLFDDGDDRSRALVAEAERAIASYQTD